MASMTKQIILSVKGGQLKATDVRDLRGVIEREKAGLGVLISLEEPTSKMRTEAASAGFYTSPWDKGKYSRLQLRSVEELLGGRVSSTRPRCRPTLPTRRPPGRRMMRRISCPSSLWSLSPKKTKIPTEVWSPVTADSFERFVPRLVVGAEQFVGVKCRRR
jgi:hypothetical protein